MFLTTGFFWNFGVWAEFLTFETGISSGPVLYQATSTSIGSISQKYKLRRRNHYRVTDTDNCMNITDT